MKSYFNRFLIVSSILCSTAFSSADEGKESKNPALVGIVDIQQVLVNVEEGKHVRSELEQVFKTKQEMLKKEEELIRTKEENFKKNMEIVEASVRDKSREELNTLFMNYQKHIADYQKEIQTMEANLKNPLIDKIRSVVEDISKKEGTSVTFESSTSSVLYAANKKDLTEAVIKAYDSKHPLKAAKQHKK